MSNLKRYCVELRFHSRYSIELLARDAGHAKRMAEAIYDQNGSTGDFELDFDTTEFDAAEVGS